MKLFLNLVFIISCTNVLPILKDIDSIELNFSKTNTKTQNLLLSIRTSKVHESVKTIFLTKDEINNLRDQLNQLNFLSWDDRDVKWRNFPQYLKITIFDGKNYITRELNDYNKARFIEILNIFQDYLFMD